jgi:transposase
MDEMGINKPLYRQYGKSLKGIRVAETIAGKRSERTSIIAGYCNKQLIAPLIFTGYTDTTMILFWVEKILIPELLSGQVVIFDNATYHKSTQITTLIESKGCKVLYLPPYSPDLNKIEKYWANLKKKLRSIWTNEKDIIENIVEGIRESSFV